MQQGASGADGAPDTTKHGPTRSGEATARAGAPGKRDGRGARLPIMAAGWAAAIGIVVAVVAQSWLGIVSPAQTFGDRLTVLIPLPLFSQFLAIFGSNAKHLYLASLLAGEGIATAALGVAYVGARARILARRGSARAGDEDVADVPAYWEAAILVGALWVLSAGIVAPLIGGGLFGSGLEGGAGALFLSELIPNGIFAVVFVRLLRRTVEEETARAGDAGEAATAAEGWSRRALLRQAGTVALVVGAGFVAWEFINGAFSSLIGGAGQSHSPDLHLGNVPDRIVPPPTPEYGAWTAVAGESPEITATEQFYYVSKNLATDPDVQQAGWRLTIMGDVEQPYSLTYAELAGLPVMERYHTLECISNEVGGDLISTATFRGVALADVLNRAGLKPGASALVFRAADGYSDSLHMSQALHPQAMIAYQINGEALPRAHGFPARLLIPGLYGMKNGKWLTELEARATDDYTGYWEERGWTREARVKTMTRIDTPHDNDLVLRAPRYIAGVAYAADRGIARVEVTTDGGTTWQAATLRRPLGGLTWTLWEFMWTPPASGTYVLGARAIDLDGRVQTPAHAAPLPDGSSGYHAVTVVVR